MSSHNPLTQLRRLDKSSPTFHDKVSNILYGEEYTRWMSGLQGEDLMGLVDYLDDVRCHVSLFRSHLTRSRPSIISIPAVPPSGSVCANSEIYAVPK